MTKIFLDNQMIDADRALIDSLTPGVLKAKGAFETMRFEQGGIVALDAHLKRLFKGLKAQKIRSQYSINKFKELILSMPPINSCPRTRIRLVVWKENRRVRTAIVSESITSSVRSCRATVSKITRPQTKLSQLKTLNYFSFRKAFLEAERQGFDEAILLNKRGEIVEGSRTNIFFVKNKILHTPALNCGCLEGVTRQIVLQIARKNNIPFRMVTTKVDSLFQADEAFLTNSVAGIVPLIKVNHHRIGNGKSGPLTRFFCRAYSKPPRLDIL